MNEKQKKIVLVLVIIAAVLAAILLFSIAFPELFSDMINSSPEKVSSDDVGPAQKEMPSTQDDVSKSNPSGNGIFDDILRRVKNLEKKKVKPVDLSGIESGIKEIKEEIKSFDVSQLKQRLSKLEKAMESIDKGKGKVVAYDDKKLWAEIKGLKKAIKALKSSGKFTLSGEDALVCAKVLAGGRLKITKMKRVKNSCSNGPTWIDGEPYCVSSLQTGVILKKMKATIKCATGVKSFWIHKDQKIK